MCIRDRTTRDREPQTLNPRRAAAGACRSAVDHPRIMRCTSVLKRLPLFAGGDLASPQCEQIERHLASCFACARAYAQTLAARDALHQLGARSREPGPWEESGDVLASRGGDETFFVRMREEIVSEAFATV